MSTNSTIRFTNMHHTDDVVLYSHYDGYPAGMSDKLVAMLGKHHYVHDSEDYSGNPTKRYETIPYYKAFIASNITNCDIINEKYIANTGDEYHYVIDCKNHTIEHYIVVWNEDDANSLKLIETLSIVDFINKYSDNPVAVEVKIERGEYLSPIYETHTKKTVSACLEYYTNRYFDFKDGNSNKDSAKMHIDSLKNSLM